MIEATQRTIVKSRSRMRYDISLSAMMAAYPARFKEERTNGSTF